MTGTFHNIWLFFRRDFSVAKTYRIAFLFQGVEALFGAAMFFYAARFVDSPQLQQALPQSGGYFAFSLAGFVFLDYFYIALDTFDRSLEEARDSGTLEHLLITQTSLPVMLAGSALYPFLATTGRIALYIAWAAILFKFPLHNANWLSVVAVLVITLLAFSGLGILSASYVLLFKRGNPAKWLLVGVSSIVSGVLFPVTILPNWLQFIAKLNPITYALESMRAALLGGKSIIEIWQPLLTLLVFAAILLPLSMTAFAWSLRRTKATGTLMHR